MSAEVTHLQRAGSPATPPHRSSPVNARRRIEDDGVINTDKPTRRYAAGIDRALSLFDNTLQEWADYISFLGRLLKALQVHPPGISDVPHKSLVAQRLSQCLNPTLPAGVHQKALEVYTFIFSLIGKDGLGRDLPYYLPGLSPLLAFASLSTKPALLALFDTFIVALDPVALRPALKAVVLALLPGLEEETSEEFEQTLGILQRLKDAVAHDENDEESVQDASGDQFFWQCLFLAAITSSSRRQGALAYLQRYLPRLGKPSVSQSQPNGQDGRLTQRLSYEVEAVTTPEPGLLIRCFVAGLNDENVLVQRGFLDMLVTHLPLHSQVLHRKVSPGDLVKLATAAVSVVSRREMSLNRRLWAWFLGPRGPTSEQTSDLTAPNRSDSHDQHDGQQIKYFRQYGQGSLTQGILDQFLTDELTPAENARPFRIALALMDRWEIGSLVVPNVLLPGLRRVWCYQKVARTPEDFAEVMRSASGFFDGIESGLIWDEISNKLLCATSMRVPNLQTFQENLDLALFVVAHFDLQEEEMLLQHLPFLALALLLKSRVLWTFFTDQEKEPEQALMYRILVLAGKLIDLMPARAFNDQTASNKQSRTLGELDANLDTETRGFLIEIEGYYAKRRGKARSITPSIDGDVLGRLMLKNMLRLIQQNLRSNRLGRVFETTISVLAKVCGKLPQNHLLDLTGLLPAAHEASGRMAAKYDGFDNELSNVVHFVALLETLRTALLRAPRSCLQDYPLRSILPNIVTALWPYLSPSSPKSNVEAVRCMWKIHSLSDDMNLVESCITALMVGNREEDFVELDSARRFGVLWSTSNSSHGSHARRSSLASSTPRRGTHFDTIRAADILARPLLLVLDTLEDRKTEISIFATSWLQSSGNVEVIVDFLQSKLQAMQSVESLFDLDQCLYYFRTLSNVIEYTPLDIWPAIFAGENHNNAVTTQMDLTRICLWVVGEEFVTQHDGSPRLSRLQQTAVSMLREVILRSDSLAKVEGEIESPIFIALSRSMRKANHPLQVSLLSLATVWLRRHLGEMTRTLSNSHGRAHSSDHSSQKNSSQDRLDGEEAISQPAAPPPLLLDCLLEGLASAGSRAVLGHWIRFLDTCLPYYISNIFQILMPLSDGLIKAVELSLNDLQMSFRSRNMQCTAAEEPVNTIIELLNGIEHVLAQAHDRLSVKATTHANMKTPEQPQGFFNHMVAGVFTPDAYKSRSTTANNRLAVLLCFKDAVRLCVRIWSWGAGGSDNPSADHTPSGSFNQISLRLKNRTRRILEHIFAAESLECLETLIDSWRGSEKIAKTEVSSAMILNLLHVLDGSRPRNTIPAIFNALYSRTNPDALDADRKSTLTSELSDIELARFLVQYTRSLEDDAMDEIWTDCITFLKDVLANPLPHRQTLPKLLEFTALLGTKVDNTNFGENRRRRRELADLFLRQLTATFTTKPLSFPTETSSGKSEKPADDPHHPLRTQDETANEDIVVILAANLPHVSKILIDGDRIATASNIISAQVVTPTLRWKSFPRNVTPSFLDLLLAMARIPEASKIWRKDVAEAFNDTRFFGEKSHDLAAPKWLPLLGQWIISDKDRMTELLARMPSPTAAGIMFGVGASSARLEADRRTQLNLRRVATLLLAAPRDSFVMQLGPIQEKVTDLFNATAASSPSSATRAEIYSLLRALILTTSPVHLASMWPSITTELQEAISSLYPARRNDKYNLHCVVHACKLLDLLVVAAPDEFQMREWLFITDTIDAVYRPQDLETSALVDDLIEDLDANAGVLQGATTFGSSTPQSGGGKPLLTSKNLRGIAREKLLDRAIRPFLRQLSIHTFESTYSMTAFDWQAAHDDLLLDIFDETNLV
ncbi:MAG: hypothetical protein LQ344_000177 [Seirophora lacunosa]|nr:MAG: hypothetical protein LQ344_000177 [Seirophora lacunosa]